MTHPCHMVRHHNGPWYGVYFVWRQNGGETGPKGVLVSVRMGEYAAENVARRLNGEKPCEVEME